MAATAEAERLHPCHRFLFANGGALAPSLLPLLTQMTSLATRVAELAETYPNLARAIVTATTVLIAGRVAAIGTAWAFLSMKAAVLSAALGIVTLGSALTPFIAISGRAAIAMTVLRQAMAGLMMIQAVGGMSAVFMTLGGALMSLLSPLRLVSGALLVLRGVLMLTGVGAALTAIAAGGLEAL